MHEPTFLYDVLILLAAAVVIVAGFRYLHLSPVLGYLVAGAAIGPHGMAIIKEVETTSTIAEIGVVFLLFMIGLELSLERLKEMRTQVLGFGSLQVGITGLVIGLAVYLTGGSVEMAVIIGGGLAFSSTALVLQEIAERNQQASQVGRLAIAVLILQDFAVVPLLVLIPILANGDPDALMGAIAMTLLKAVGAMLAIFVVGRLLIRPLFRIIANTKNPDLFSATTLLIILGSSFATEQAGLSLALGAFIAGLLVAETEFQHQVEADMTPFKGLFMGLFFITVGMSIDAYAILTKFWVILGWSLALVAVKASIIIGLCMVFRYRISNAFHAGMLLSQGSEFAFILFGLAATQGLLRDSLTELLLVVVTFTMALTPLLASAGRTIGKRIERRVGIKNAQATNETTDLDKHVIICGFGRMGQTLADILDIEKKTYVAIDMDPKNIALGREQHRPVYYGDARRLEVLQAVGVDRASYVVFAFTHPTAEVRAIRAIKRIRPDITIICRAMQSSHAKLLRAAGADVVVLEALEASLHLGRALLREKNINEEEVTRVLDMYREQSGA